MRKILAVAATDFRQVVLTKTFILSLLFLPLIVGISVGAQFLIRGTPDTRDRTLAIVDQTGELFAGLQTAASMRNATQLKDAEGKQQAGAFVLEEVPADGRDVRELEILLSERVRNGEIFAFAIFGADLLAPGDRGDSTWAYYTDTPTHQALPSWLRTTTRKIIEDRRFSTAGIDAERVAFLRKMPDFAEKGLAEVDSAGNIIAAEDQERLRAFLLPMAILFFIYFAINMASPVMLNSVIEEKMARIVEVLLSSVTPFQIMAGKIIAGSLAGLVFSLVYLTAAIGALIYFDRLDWLQPAVLVWYPLFLIVGLLSFGSFFGIIGAACTDIKDTQNFMWIIVIVMIVPIMLSFAMVESPDSPFAIAASLVPPFSVLLMPMRVAIPPGPALWEPVVALLLAAALALLLVWVAARVFRVGLLVSGKAPKPAELIRWILKG